MFVPLIHLQSCELITGIEKIKAGKQLLNREMKLTRMKKKINIEYRRIEIVLLRPLIVLYEALIVLYETQIAQSGTKTGLCAAQIAL